MPITKQEFIDLLSVGKLCYFISKHINSPEPHYHLIVSDIQDGDMIMFCGTSRPESTTKFLDHNNIDYCTFVPTEPSGNNELTKSTYFHCNQPYQHTIDSLFGLYNSGMLRFRGVIAEHELFNVKIGIEASPLIEEDVKALMLAAFPDF